MAKAFSVASWNVEHFRGDPSRVERIVAVLRQEDGGNSPDVFALYEVVGGWVYRELVTQMPGYQFHITEGPQAQEILVGVRRSITAFFTQKVEFKSGNRFLRPGALLTLNIGQVDYSVLFLHTKSSTNPIGLGIRDDMFYRAFRLKRKLDRVAGGAGRANFLIVGDLNTMGMKYPYNREIDPEFELRRLNGRAGRSRMVRLDKDRLHTWWGGADSSLPPSDLDHVVASKQLSFRQFGSASVSVRGWPALATENQQAQWVRDYSDHALLYFEVQKS